VKSDSSSPPADASPADAPQADVPQADVPQANASATVGARQDTTNKQTGKELLQ